MCERHVWCVTQTRVISSFLCRYFSFDSISVCYVGKISLTHFVRCKRPPLIYLKSKPSHRRNQYILRWRDTQDECKSVSNAGDKGRNRHWVVLNFKPWQHEAGRIEFRGAECSVASAKGVEKVAGIDDSLGAVLRHRCKHSTSLIVFLTQE